MVTSATHLSATTLIGDAVENRQGESLGDLKEIMLDTANGTIAYGVLSFGGVLGIGDKLFAVPWNALTIDHHGHKLILDVSKERLRDAPGFDKGHWPDFADTAFAEQVNTYYTRH